MKIKIIKYENFEGESRLVLRGDLISSDIFELSAKGVRPCFGIHKGTGLCLGQERTLEVED